MPVFSRVYHMQPSEFWRLTVSQFACYMDDLVGDGEEDDSG